LKSSGGAQAKLTGTKWVGLVVAPGGTLALDGVDIENAKVAIDVQAKAAAASYGHGTITAATAPFLVEAKAALTTSHATVVGSLGTSHVLGALTASYLDYDANGFDGITGENDDATISIEDSKLHGGGGASDMIVSYTGVGNVHVAYTEITHVHCAFHFERMTGLDVSYVTATGDNFGLMLYGSLATGTKSIKSSNFYGEFEWGIQEGPNATNGAITVDGCYFSGNASGNLDLKTPSTIQVVNESTAMVAGAGPR
jgi:hypothetical protein